MKSFKQYLKEDLYKNSPYLYVRNGSNEYIFKLLSNNRYGFAYGKLKEEGWRKLDYNIMSDFNIEELRGNDEVKPMSKNEFEQFHFTEVY